MDIYTPTKDIDGLLIPPIGTPQTPDVYIPTKITTAPPSYSTPQKPEEGSTRQKYGGTDTYSPSYPGIRIVKRKPKDGEPSTSSPLTKNARTESSGDAVANLKQLPKKGILRHPGQKRPTRRIFFADTRGLPLCAVKEIERLANIQNHSNYADFRTFEKNEACFGRHVSDLEWNVIAVKGARPPKENESESGRREQARIENLPHFIKYSFIPKSAILEDNPDLTEQARTDCQAYTPIIIPHEPITVEKHTLQTLRDLPLPGRKRQAENQLSSHQPSQVNTYSQNTYEQVDTNDMSTVYQATMDTSKPSSISQIFQESDQQAPNNYYTSSSTSEAQPPKAELPASLNLLLSQLKKKGLVSSEETPTPTATPLASALQAAQQMMQNQQTVTTTANVNSYSQEFSGQEFVNGYDGYIAEFVTPEMSAQELRQDSRHAERWTQSGFKIHEPCAYFVNRRDGCNRGDQCRFIHDEEMRRQKQSEFQNRRDYRHDGGFRGNRRGNFRGGFRNNHHDRDFRGGGGGYNDNNRFAGHGNGYQRPGRGFDQPPPYREDYNFSSGPPVSSGHPPSSGSLNPSQMDQQQLDAAVHTQMYGPGATKKRRVSRFDQRDDDGAPPRDLDHRPPRRNRFDEGPAAGRQFRSRFDEKPRDQDDRGGAQMGNRSF